MKEKTEKAIGVLAKEIEKANSPVVMCSFGKDSMVLLHLVRTITKSIPVFFIRNPLTEWKQEFANDIISKWQLMVHSFPPSIIDYAYDKKAKAVFGMELYDLGRNQHLTIPEKLYPIQKNSPVTCVIRDYKTTTRVRGTRFVWDVGFVGQKNNDYGEVLNKNITLNGKNRRVGKMDICFPLSDWSDEDIWEYTEAQGVPYNAKRYDKNNGYKEFESGAFNNDYIEACTDCVHPDIEGKIFCPIFKKEVPNMSKIMNYGNNSEKYKTFIDNFFKGV